MSISAYTRPPLPEATELVAFIRRNAGSTLETLDDIRPFKADVSGVGLVFFPNGGLGARREVSFAKLVDFLARMRELRPLESRQPSAYKDESHNASYILGLVQAWEEEAAGVFASPERRTRPDHLTSQQRSKLLAVVKESVGKRATVREPNGRIKHGFEVERAASIQKLKWVGSVYWSDNLPSNDVEVAFHLGRLSRSDSELALMRAWFLDAVRSVSSRPARNHSNIEIDCVRAGFTFQNALIFFEMLGKQFDPMTRKPWVVEKRESWKRAIEAVSSLGGATSEQVGRWILAQEPSYEIASVGRDLNMLTVNYLGRGDFEQNKRARRSDSGSEFDALFFDGAYYVIYSPALHGVWRLLPYDGDGVLRPELLELPVELELSSAEKLAEADGAFDPSDRTDAREKLIATIVRRRGQVQFREALLRAYDRRCAITGFNVAHALEAAHITPYLGERTNVVSNGLLLRADLHTLFDLGLLWIEPSSMEVRLHSTLADSSYAPLQGSVLRLPELPADWPDPEALLTHLLISTQK